MRLPAILDRIDRKKAIFFGYYLNKGLQSIYRKVHTEEQIDLCIRNAAFEQYMAATGRDLATDISQKCDGAIANGFFSTLTFGHGQKYSKEEMISKLYGKKPPQSTEIKKAVGKLGGVVAYAGAGALTLGWIPVIGPLLGAGIGAGVGILASMA